MSPTTPKANRLIPTVALLALLIAPLAAAQPPPGMGPHPPPACERTLTAQAQDDGHVLLEWEAAVEEHNVLFYRILRDGEVLAHTNDTSYLDTTTEGGETYAYRVEAHGDGAGDTTVFTVCGEVEATAVPFFGGAIAMAIAIAGTIGGYVWARRR